MKTTKMRKTAKPLTALARSFYETSDDGSRLKVNHALAVNALARALTRLRASGGTPVVVPLSEQEGLAFPSQHAQRPGTAYAMALWFEAPRVISFKVERSFLSITFPALGSHYDRTLPASALREAALDQAHQFLLREAAAGRVFAPQAHGLEQPTIRFGRSLASKRRDAE